MHYYTDSFLLEQITILPNRLSTIDRTLRRRKKNEEEDEENEGKKERSNDKKRIKKRG